MSRKSILEKYQLAKIKRGDTESFAKLYDNLAPQIYRFTLFKVKSPQEAEDITSEAFLKVWHYIHGGEVEIKSLRAFVYRVTRNLIVDYYRVRAQRISLDSVPLEAVEETIPHDSTMSATAELESDVALLYRTLLELKEEYREVLVLKYIDDLSTEEISEILHKNAGAVRTQLSRALSALREILPKDITIHERKRVHTKPQEA